jgi:hypothetical protein
MQDRIRATHIDDVPIERMELRDGPHKEVAAWL